MTYFFIMATNGFTAPLHAALKNSRIDPWGGGDNTFSVPLFDGASQTWMGAGWRMPVQAGWTPPLSGDYHLWLNGDPTDWMFGRDGFLEIADLVAGSDLKINTKTPQQQIALYAEYELEEFGVTAYEKWLAALADTARKRDALTEPIYE